METLRQEFEHLAHELVQYKAKDTSDAPPIQMHDTFGAEMISPKKTAAVAKLAIPKLKLGGK